jgi:hypothetical protein
MSVGWRKMEAAGSPGDAGTKERESFIHSFIVIP